MKKEIIETIKEEFEGVRLVEVFITEEKVNKKEIQDVMGKEIFGIEEAEGYFVFVDYCSIANWAHSCAYRFYQEDIEMEEKQELWMPKNYKEMKKIEIAN